LQGKTASIIPFPVDRVARPGPVAAMHLEARRGHLRQRLELFRAHRAGAIQEVDLDDSPTGQRLSVWVGEHYVRLCVDGQDYYFDRVTGQFDGIGATP
jgi:hypothetical protein